MELRLDGAASPKPDTTTTQHLFQGCDLKGSFLHCDIKSEEGRVPPVESHNISVTSPSAQAGLHGTRGLFKGGFAHVSGGAGNFTPI